MLDSNNRSYVDLLFPVFVLNTLQYTHAFLNCHRKMP